MTVTFSMVSRIRIREKKMRVSDYYFTYITFLMCIQNGNIYTFKIVKHM